MEQTLAKRTRKNHEKIKIAQVVSLSGKRTTRVPKRFGVCRIVAHRRAGRTWS